MQQSSKSVICAPTVVPEALWVCMVKTTCITTPRRCFAIFYCGDVGTAGSQAVALKLYHDALEKCLTFY